MSAPAKVGLVRVISRTDLTFAIVNGIIGSSIFGMPSALAALVGVWSPLVALVAGLFVLSIVLCFAEVASRFDAAGGPYLYAREAFGPAVGFQAGWLTFWIRVTSASANLNIFVSYLASSVPWAAGPWQRALVMTVVMLVIAAINIRGVALTTWAIDVLTVAKLLPLLLLIVLGLPRLDGAVLQTQAVDEPQWLQAILLLVFAYGGFETPLLTAGEARNPRRDSAPALIVALGLVTAFYLLVQLTVVGIVPHVAGVNAPVAAAFGSLLGPGGALLATLTALVSVYGWATGSVLHTPRLLYAMAERHELPGALARLHSRFRTPVLAIVVYATCSLALGIYGGFLWNATLSAIVRLVTYGLTCAALPVFRQRDAEPPGFTLPAARVVTPVALAFCVLLLATRPFSQAWVLLALVIVGIALNKTGRPRTMGESC